MELNILHAIQAIHNPILDALMITVFNNLVGSLGKIWIIVGVVLLLIPKTRKCGAAVLLSYVVSFLIGNEWLKDLIARPRPCAVDSTVSLITKRLASGYLYLLPLLASAVCISLSIIQRMYCSERFWVL